MSQSALWGCRERQKASLVSCYVTKMFCKCFGRQKFVSQLDWAINFPVGARIHYPAVLMAHYSN